MSLYYPTNASIPAATPAEADHSDNHGGGKRHLSAGGTSSVHAKGHEDAFNAIASSADTATHHAENSPTKVCINTPSGHRMPDEGAGGCCGRRQQ
jgi:hypothetical protein